MTSVRVKLCGVRRPEDAVLCAEAGADEVGVVFAAHSKRRVTVEEARRIRAALPAQVPLVGVFQDAPLDAAMRIAREVGLAALQFHGKLPEPGGDLPLYAAVQVNGAELERTPELAGFRRVLLDGPSGGSGVSFAWAVARRVRGSVAEVFVAGGLTAANVAEAIRAADPHGVDVASGIEGPDGFKDPDRVRAFVRAARGAR
jgi:phosphoribosylanthranilate isomerase